MSSNSHEAEWLRKSASNMAVVAVFNVLLALLALFREILSASVLGAGKAADEFFLAYFYPDTIWNLLLGSALAQASLPVFSRLRAQAMPVGRVFSYFSTLSLGLGLVFTLLVAVLSPLMGVNSTFLTLFRIIALAAPLYPPSLMLIAQLQVAGRFAYASSAQLVFNAVYTAVLLHSSVARVPDTTAAFWQSVAIPASALAMFLATYLFVNLSGDTRDRVQLSFSLAPDPASKQVLAALAAPVLLAGGNLILPFVERFVAASLSEGSIASLNYAFKISQFPVWVLSAAIGAVTFPALADSLARDSGRVQSIIRSSVGMMLLVSCPTAFALFSLRNPVVLTVFSMGSSNPPAVIAMTLGAYCLAIVPQSIAIIAVRYHLAKRSTSLLIYSALLSSVLGGAVNLLFTPRFGLPVVGVGLAVQSVVSLLILAPEVWKKGGLGAAGLWRPVLCALPMLLCGAFYNALSGIAAPSGAMALVARLGISSLSCASLSLVLGLWLGIPELRLLWAKARTRLLGVAS